MDTPAVTTYSCPDTRSLLPAAAEILATHAGKRVFVLYGEMGSGKTTLIQAFCKSLGCRDVVTSPTFTIVNEYLSSAGEPIYHFDFYRINSDAEVHDLGFEDYLYSGSYCFIEWPERISGFLSGTEVVIRIETADTQRTILVTK